MSPRSPQIAPIFQSTPPARGATGYTDIPLVAIVYFNPRPPRGGRLVKHIINVIQTKISIHAPREGGDNLATTVNADLDYISIHAPREGGDDAVYRP